MRLLDKKLEDNAYILSACLFYKVAPTIVLRSLGSRAMLKFAGITNIIIICHLKIVSLFYMMTCVLFNFYYMRAL